MKYLRNNPFVFLSLVPLIIGNALVTIAMFILVSLTGLTINTTQTVFKLEGIQTIIVIPLAAIIGLMLIKVGFKKKEDRKGLIMSLLINVLFLSSSIMSFIMA